MAIHKLELVRDDDVPIIPLRDKQYSPRPDPLYIVDATYTKRKEKMKEWRTNFLLLGLSIANFYAAYEIYEYVRENQAHYVAREPAPDRESK
jgi:hypothetical protein